MNFFIRCDIHSSIGSGHAFRCLNLAKILIKYKHEVFFISKYINENFKKILLKNKIKLIFLKKNLNEINDAEDTLLKIKKIFKKNDWIIVDSYKLGLFWEKKINTYCKNIFVIDDFQDRKHKCKLFLNQNIIAKKTKNIHLSKDANVIIGPKYSLLDEKFNELRKKARIRKKFDKVMLFFVSIDEFNLTEKCTDILLSLISKNVKLNLIIGSTNKYKNQIFKKYAKKKQIKILFNLENLANHMLDTDAFIGSGGVTTWERCCLKLPSLVISTAKNQESHNRYLLKKKCYNVFRKS